MPSRHPLPRPGDRLSYRRQRELVRHVQAARQLAGEGGLQVALTGAGSVITMPKAPALMLAEIVDRDCGWKQETRSSGWPTDWHYTVGRPVLYYLTDGTWAVPTPAMDADSSSSSSGILDEYIVHPTGYPEPIAEEMRLHDVFWPLYSVGDWVWCVRDFESGLWAIHDGYESWLRFELQEHLATGTSAMANLVQCVECPPEEVTSSSGVCFEANVDACRERYVVNEDIEFRVWDGLCAWEGQKKQRGYCKFFAESRRFEVVMLARSFVRIELAEDLDQWTTTPVNLYRRCWDPSANDGEGGFETDCDQTLRGFDPSEVGYFGYASEGATGVVELFQADNGQIGVLTDLRCPIECICGETGPPLSCEASSSSSGS